MAQPEDTMKKAQNTRNKIDITIDGIGAGSGPAPAPVRGSKIDIPLGKSGAGKKQAETDITETEFAFVNRHHEEVKAQRRAARGRGE